MYEDINKVLENIKLHFETKFDEPFEMVRSGRYVTYQSHSYYFKVMAAFIQARVASDFLVSIEDRIDEVIKSVSIEKNAHYRFTSKSVDKPLPIEYCLDLIE
ncbi:hypothetical protein [uncultured Photobacterium sp.]|uniref:hypothetical protein n=1 Tax=uncultured Photobacterium sp. TaxID=173973 RepID=UPI0026255F30|nr:hypothetical protein [uncultured Photobacterium sp.]